MVQAQTLLKRFKTGSLALLFLLTQASLALTPFINTQKAFAASPSEECAPLEFLVKYESDEATGTFNDTVADDGGQDVITFTNIELKEEDGKKEIIGFDWSSTTPVDKVLVSAGNKAAIQSGDEIISGSYDTDFTGEQGFDSNKGVSHVTFCYDPAPSSITIVKDAVPNSLDNFNFTASGTGVSGFTLDDDNQVDGADDTYAKNKVFNSLSAGTYTFTEAETTGWQLEDITCSQGSTNEQSIENRTVTITLAAGENVTCTFENRPVEQIPETGDITIVKDAQPNSTQDFQFTVETDRRGGGETLDDEDAADEDGEYDNSFTLEDQVAGTTWTITEAVTTGWELDDIICSGQTDSTVTIDVQNRNVEITIAANENVSCTFVNKPVVSQPETGSLQVLKQVDEGEGYESVGLDSDFKWFLDDDPTERNMGITVSNLEPDTYEVTENIEEMTDYEFVGWFLGDGNCDEVDGTTYPVGVTITANETTTVTLCNKVKDDKKVELCHATGADKYVKISISPAGAFNGHLDESLGGGATQGNHQDGEDIIEPFTYKGENYQQNWDSEGRAIFDNGCEIPEETHTGVTFHKIAFPKDGTDFTFDVSKDDIILLSLSALDQALNGENGLVPDTFTLDDANPDDGDEYADSKTLILEKGAVYQVTERVTDGWRLVDAWCEGAVAFRDGNTLTILVPGDEADVDCYFENEKNPAVRVTKFNDLDRDGVKDENEETLPGWNMTLRGEAEAEQPTICDFLPEFPGCDGNGFPGLCGFPFPPCETQLNAQFELPCGSFPFPSCEEDYEYSKTQTTGQDGSTTFENVKPGVQHELTETQQVGWVLSSMDCSGDGEQTEDSVLITAQPGETVECFVGNYRDTIIQELTKENDSPTADNGDTVTYTLTYSVPLNSGAAFDVCVSDLLPAGFTFNGTWTATGTDDVEENVETASEDCGEPGGPSYDGEGPGEWYVGMVLPGETVVLTYQTVIGDEVTPGTYTNIAFASAYECNRTLEQECDREDTPFVESDVTLLAGGRGGQVLGASTTRTVLVETGDSSTLIATIVAAILLVTTFMAIRWNPNQKGIV